MPRRRKTQPLDENQKKRVRSFRSKERREQRKRRTDNKRPDDITWLTNIALHMSAMRIINNHKERPYWVSIPWGENDGIEPVSGYLPCSSIRTKTRVYYGFLFREHRDAMYLEHIETARKEFTDFRRE